MLTRSSVFGKVVRRENKNSEPQGSAFLGHDLNPVFPAAYGSLNLASVNDTTVNRTEPMAAQCKHTAASTSDSVANNFDTMHIAIRFDST